VQGQDIALLLKLAIQNEPNLPSKELAEGLFISPSEVSKALKRCVDSGLLYISGAEKRVHRTALLEFLGYGLRYAFPPVKGSLVRGVPTAAAAEPLKSRLWEDGEPPTVWPYAEGKVWGIPIIPLYKGAPKAALLDSRFYGVLALSDASAAAERGNAIWQSKFLKRRSMPDPNLPLLEDAVRKLAPFLDEIVFVGGITLGLLITDEAAAPIHSHPLSIHSSRPHVAERPVPEQPEAIRFGPVVATEKEESATPKPN
jgi:hypothetical protein